MPVLQQVQCFVARSDTNEAFQEQAVHYGDGVVDCFICIPDSITEFYVNLKSLGYIAPGLSMQLFVDGIYACNRNRCNLVLPRPGLPEEASKVDFTVRQTERFHNGQLWGQPLYFAPIPESQKQYIRDHPEGGRRGWKYGTIFVKVLRCFDDPVPTDPLSAFGPSPLSDALKLRPKSGSWGYIPGNAGPDYLPDKPKLFFGLDGANDDPDDEDRKRARKKNSRLVLSRSRSNPKDHEVQRRVNGSFKTYATKKEEYGLSSRGDDRDKRSDDKTTSAARSTQSQSKKDSDALGIIRETDSAKAGNSKEDKPSPSGISDGWEHVRPQGDGVEGQSKAIPVPLQGQVQYLQPEASMSLGRHIIDEQPPTAYVTFANLPETASPLNMSGGQTFSKQPDRGANLGKSATHYVAREAPAPYAHSKRTPGYMDTREKPFTEFRFHYRTADALREILDPNVERPFDKGRELIERYQREFEEEGLAEEKDRKIRQAEREYELEKSMLDARYGTKTDTLSEQKSSREPLPSSKVGKSDDKPVSAHKSVDDAKSVSSSKKLEQEQTRQPVNTKSQSGMKPIASGWTNTSAWEGTQGWGKAVAWGSGTGNNAQTGRNEDVKLQETTTIRWGGDDEETKAENGRNVNWGGSPARTDKSKKKEATASPNKPTSGWHDTSAGQWASAQPHASQQWSSSAVGISRAQKQAWPAASEPEAPKGPAWSEGGKPKVAGWEQPTSEWQAKPQSETRKSEATEIRGRSRQKTEVWSWDKPSNTKHSPSHKPDLPRQATNQSKLTNYFKSSEIAPEDAAAGSKRSDNEQHRPGDPSIADGQRARSSAPQAETYWTRSGSPQGRKDQNARSTRQQGPPPQWGSRHASPKALGHKKEPSYAASWVETNEAVAEKAKVRLNTQKDMPIKPISNDKDSAVTAIRSSAKPMQANEPTAAASRAESHLREPAPSPPHTSGDLAFKNDSKLPPFKPWREVRDEMAKEMADSEAVEHKKPEPPGEETAATKAKEDWQRTGERAFQCPPHWSEDRKKEYFKVLAEVKAENAADAAAAAAAAAKDAGFGQASNGLPPFEGWKKDYNRRKAELEAEDAERAAQATLDTAPAAQTSPSNKQAYNAVEWTSSGQWAAQAQAGHPSQRPSSRAASHPRTSPDKTSNKTSPRRAASTVAAGATTRYPQQHTFQQPHWSEWRTQQAQQHGRTGSLDPHAKPMHEAVDKGLTQEGFVRADAAEAESKDNGEAKDKGEDAPVW